MSDNEEVTFKRKHKALLRRAGSFKRMQSLPQRVDHWFNSDPALHASWGEFAAKHRDASPMFSLESSAFIEADHTSRLIHEQFCDAFEASLSSYLSGLEVTMDQFQEAFRISREEEQRDGECFYRWPEVVEFPVFLHLMRGGPKALLAQIQKLSDDARLDFRRRVTFFPLIVQWSPESLDVVDAALDEAMKSEGVSHGLSKAQLKEMVRWRAKLTAKTVVGGVYTPPQRNEEAWARYLAFKTSQLGPIALEGVIEALQRRVTTGGAASSDTTERQELLKCFNALDELHFGSVATTHLTTAVLKSGVVPEKSVKKVIACFLAKRNQSTQDGKPCEDSERLPLVLALDLLRDLLYPATGDDASQLFCARLRRVAEVAEDRM